MFRVTRQRRCIRASLLWLLGGLVCGLGLPGGGVGTSSQAASLSPLELIDKATLRVDLGSHYLAINAVAASPDGRLLATGGHDRVVRLWDSQTGELVRTLRPPSQDIGLEGRIYALAFAPDGRHLAVAGSLRYWDAAEGRGSGVYLFDTSSGQLLRHLPGTPSSPEYDRGYRLVFSRDGQRLFLLSGKINVQRLGGARVYFRPLGDQPEASEVVQSSYADVDVAPDGRAFLVHASGVTVLTSYSAERIRPSDGKYIHLKSEPDSYLNRRTYAVRVSPRGDQLAISFEERGRIEIRDSRSFKLLGELELDPEGDLRPGTIEWAPDGQSLLYIGNPQPRGLVKKGGRLQRVLLGKKLRAVPLWQHSADILSIAQLADGSILCGTADASFALLSADGRERLQKDADTLLPSDPTELYTDDTGRTVWLRSGPKPKDTVGFSLAKLLHESRLQVGKPVDDALHPPRIEVPAPYVLNGWRHQGLVTLNDAALPIRSEEPYSLAVAPDQRSFVLGTSGGLRRFPFDRAASASDCPLPKVAGSDLPSPCFETALPAPALAVNFSGDGRYVIAALADGSIRWFRALDGRPELSFVLHRDKRRWVLFQPQGRYVASIGGAALVGWQVNPAQVRAATLFPLDRFAAKLYDPARLAQSLPAASDAGRLALPLPEERPIGQTGGNLVPAQPLRKPPNLPTYLDPAKPSEPVPLRGMLPPVATILSPSDGATVADGQVTLRVLVHSPVRQAIRGVRVLVNGRLDTKARGVIDVSADPAEPGAKAGSGSGPGAAALVAAPGLAAGAGEAGSRGSGVEVYSLPVALPPGRSSVAVYAEGSAGASLPVVIHIRNTAEQTAAAASRPRLLVLAVGVGAYPRPDLQLTYPAKDANDLARVLKELGGRLYGEVVVRVVTDEQASLSGIRAGFTWLRDRLQPEDTALIFLAGHGINEAGSGQYVFLPRDVDLSRAAETGLSAGELQRVLGGLPSRVLLFLDTCHAGNVLSVRRSREVPTGPDESSSQAGDVTRFVGDLAGVEQGIVVMAASTGRQLSQESPQWQNGAFTLALIEGLRGSADFRRTGRVTVNMLDLYVSERVRELTDGAQTPATAKPVTIPDFPVITLR